MNHPSPGPWTVKSHDANPVDNVEYHVLGSLTSVRGDTPWSEEMEFHPIHVAVVTGPLTPKRNGYAAPGSSAKANAAVIGASRQMVEILRVLTGPRSIPEWHKAITEADELLAHIDWEGR